MSEQQPPTYEIGQIVNGHRWTGSTWEPVEGVGGAPTMTATAPVVAATKKPIWKRWWFWVLAVLLLIIIGSVLGGGGSKNAANPSTSPTTAPSTPASTAPSEEPSEQPSETAVEEPAGSDLAALGTPVRDGKFEFTAKSVKCGVKSVGPSGFGEKAQGQFCLVTVKVTNIGDEAQTLFDSNQVVFTADGKKFESDTAAALYANKDSSVFIEEINPGNSVTGVLVYDMPKNAKPTIIEFHDSAFSGGVQASLV